MAYGCLVAEVSHNPSLAFLEGLLQHVPYQTARPIAVFQRLYLTQYLSLVLGPSDRGHML